jgi:hypothetical protein
MYVPFFPPLFHFFLFFGFQEAANADGWTALHYAAQNGDVKMAELLLMHGAEPQSR